MARVLPTLDSKTIPGASRLIGKFKPKMGECSSWGIDQ
jgi:hypothetical protein